MKRRALAEISIALIMLLIIASLTRTAPPAKPAAAWPTTVPSTKDVSRPMYAVGQSAADRDLHDMHRGAVYRLRAIHENGAARARLARDMTWTPPTFCGTCASSDRELSTQRYEGYEQRMKDYLAANGLPDACLEPWVRLALQPEASFNALESRGITFSAARPLAFSEGYRVRLQASTTVTSPMPGLLPDHPDCELWFAPPGGTWARVAVVEEPVTVVVNPSGSALLLVRDTSRYIAYDLVTRTCLDDEDRR